MSEALSSKQELAEIAEQLGIRAAKPWIRALAFVIDLLVWALLVSPAVIGVMLVLEHGFGLWSIVLLSTGAVLSLGFCIVQLILHGRRGVTLGKASMKLRTVSLPGLSKPGFWRIVWRSLILALSNILPIVGPILIFSSCYWDSRGRYRSLIDKAGGCWLIDVADGLDPTDANALRRAKRNYDAQFRDISEHLPPLVSGVPLDTGILVALRSDRSSASVIGAERERWITQGTHEAPRHALPEQTPTTWELLFDDATRLTVTSFGLIGRAPQQLQGRAIAQLVPLQDPERMLSKLHLAFGADEYGVWIEDLGSSNGTEVLQPGELQARRLDSGEVVRLGEGAGVQIGGRGFRVQREELHV